MKVRASTQYEFLNGLLKIISDKQYSEQSWERTEKQLGHFFLAFSSETEENIHCLEHLEYGISANNRADLNRVGFKIKGKDILISDIMNALEDLDTPPAAVKAYFPELTIAEWNAALEGITVGGHRLADQQQVLNQSKSLNRLLTLVKQHRFALNKSTFTELHGLVAFEETLEWGVFRTSAANIAGTAHQPPPAPQLESIFETGVDSLNRLENPVERGIAMFLFGSLNQFFYDGNKRTSRLMMNGILLSHGIDAINVPAKRKLEFNQQMIKFYDTKEADDMMQFMVS